MKTMIPLLLDASHTIRRLRARNAILEAKVEVLDIIGAVTRRPDGCYATPEYPIEDRLDRQIQEFESQPDPGAEVVKDTAGPSPSPATQVRMARTVKKVLKKPLPRAPKAASEPASSLDKPTSVVGAMKFLLRDEAEPFTAELLRENLQDEADFKKLLEADGGEKSFQQALYNWVYTGKLKKDGDNYSITATGKEWFGK